MRLLPRALGLLIIAASYVIFRPLLLPRTGRCSGHVLVGVNHSILMISRLAMRENTAVLVEVRGLSSCSGAFRQKPRACDLWGGVVAGLGLYVYYPGRVDPASLTRLLAGGGAVLTGGRGRLASDSLPRHVAVAGFVAAATPILNPESRIPTGTKRSAGDSR